MTKNDFIKTQTAKLIKIVSGNDPELLPEEEKEALRKYNEEFLEELKNIANGK